MNTKLVILKTDRECRKSLKKKKNIKKEKNEKNREEWKKKSGKMLGRKTVIITWVFTVQKKKCA